MRRNHERINALEEQRGVLGQEIHLACSAIHQARQKIKQARSQESVDVAAIAEQVEVKREAHSRVHSLKPRLDYVKEAIQLEQTWPGPDAWI